MEDTQKAQTKLVLCWCRKQKNGSKIDKSSARKLLHYYATADFLPQGCHIRVRAEVFWAETWRAGFGFETELIVRRRQ